MERRVDIETLHCFIQLITVAHADQLFENCHTKHKKKQAVFCNQYCGARHWYGGLPFDITVREF